MADGIESEMYRVIHLEDATMQVKLKLMGQWDLGVNDWRPFALGSFGCFRSMEMLSLAIALEG